MGEGPPPEWSGDTDKVKYKQHQKRVNVDDPPRTAYKLKTEENKNP